jgi:hypothetical protein
MFTSVACAIGPSVNTFFIFHIFKNDFEKEFGNVNTLRGSTELSLQTHFLQFVWISSNKIKLKINIFHTLALKIVK